MSQSFRTSPFLVGDPLPTTPFFHARLLGLQATTRLPDGQFPCAQSSMHGIQAWQQGYGYAHVRFWKALFQSSDTLASWSFNAASDRPTSLELFWTHLHIRERTDGIQNFGPIWHPTRGGARPPDLEQLPKQSFFCSEYERWSCITKQKQRKYSGCRLHIYYPGLHVRPRCTLRGLDGLKGCLVSSLPLTTLDHLPDHKVTYAEGFNMRYCQVKSMELNDTF